MEPKEEDPTGEEDEGAEANFEEAYGKEELNY
jgi:hypothetical protein